MVICHVGFVVLCFVLVCIRFKASLKFVSNVIWFGGEGGGCTLLGICHVFILRTNTSTESCQQI